MTKNEENEKMHRYVCFHCIEGSVDPETCSNCGAKIENLDFESAMMVPPQDGHYRIEFVNISEEMFDAALNAARGIYLQKYDIKRDEHGVDVRSNDIAYDRLIKTFGENLSISLNDLKKFIAFKSIT